MASNVPASFQAAGLLFRMRHTSAFNNAVSRDLASPMPEKSGDAKTGDSFPGSGNGAGEGTRTPDPIITNDVLYQLSYTGVCAPRCEGFCGGVPLRSPPPEAAVARVLQGCRRGAT